jgi:hypothetical protein
MAQVLECLPLGPEFKYSVQPNIPTKTPRTSLKSTRVQATCEAISSNQVVFDEDCGGQNLQIYYLTWQKGLPRCD